jgi:tRNA-2-methylthio-N6-dimethylallyladenosine synthase
MEGQVHDILVEGRSKWEEDVACGRTGTFKMVNFPGSLDLVGRTVPVRILRGFSNSLRGEMLAAPHGP